MAFARAELMMLGGGGELPLVPVVLLPLTGHTPPMEGLVPGQVWCQSEAGRSPYRAQVYTVYTVPSVLASNLYLDFRASP